MSGHWPAKQLGEIFEIARGGSPRPIEKYITKAADGLNWIKIGDASASGKYIERTREKIRPEGLGKTRSVSPGDFLLTNSMSFGRPYIMATHGCIHDGWLVLKPRSSELVHPEYFYYLLSSDQIYRQFSSRAGGSTVKNLNTEIVASVEVRLPPLSEQRRIAAILDKADALRRKRKRAIELLDSLRQSIFLEMFGDAKHLPTKPLGKALSRRLRNGLSPAKSGSIKSKVLTLSAITGKVFKADAVKEADFTAESPASQRVAEGDFLICRGNGNKSLVGVGVTAPFSMPDTTFPDTIIAGRIDDHWFDSHYFEHVWNSPIVRRQIEQSARTTNGTFKVNQKVLERVEIPLPDSRLQTEFGQRVTSIGSQLARYQDQLDHQQRLFFSLQSRAFSGQL